MKKFIGLLCAFSLAASSVTFAKGYTDIEKSDNKAAIELISDFGIMEGEDDYFMPEDLLTRATFAQLLYNIYCNDGVAEEKFFGVLEKGYESDKNTDTSINNSYYYVDVPDYHWASEYINEVTQRGLMQGGSDSCFEPDKYIKTEEAVKTFMYCFGISANANSSEYYPEKIMAEAASKGVLKRISAKKGDYISKGEIAQLIYNCLDLPVLKFEVGKNGERKLYSNEDETVLTEIFKLNKLTDIMTENSITSYSGTSELGKDEIRIGDTVLKYESDMSYVNDLIGHRVEVYYRENSDGDNALVTIDKAAKDQSTVISADDVLSFKNDILSYESDNRVKTIKIPNGSKIIYNGNAISTWDENTFVFQSGNIEIIQNKSSCDLVVVENYEAMHISGLNIEESIIYNDIASDVSQTEIKKEDNDCLIILDSEMNTIKLTDLAVGDVLSVIKNDGYIKIIVSRNTIEGKVSSVNNAEGKIIVDGQNEYEYAKNYLACQNYKQVAGGEVAICYLDAFGKIAWVEVENNFKLEGGYLAKAYVDDNDELCYKIFRTSGFFTVFKAADKVTYVDEKENSTRLSNDDRKLKSGFVYFQVNTDGKISRVTSPSEGYKSKEAARCIAKIASNDSIPYRTSSKSFGGKIFVDTTTTVMVVPKTETSYTEYKITDTSSFVDNGSYVVEGYTSDPTSPVAQVLVYHPADSTGKIGSGRRAAFVLDITTDLDENDEPVCVVTVEFENKNKTLKAKIDDKGESLFSNMKNPQGSTTTYALQKGDIIVFSEGIDGYVDSARIVYSRSMSYPGDSTQKGFLAGVTTDKYYISKDYVNLTEKTHSVYKVNTAAAEKSDKANNNPYATEIDSPMNYAYKYSMYGFRFYVGYIYDYDDGFITITTQNLKKDPQYLYNGVPQDAEVENGYVGIYLTENYKYSSFTEKKYVEYYGKNVSISNLDEAQIKTFKKYGNNCSKVLVKTRDGYAQQLYVINDVK